MSRKSGLYAHVNEKGHLIFPADTAERYGLKPGAEIEFHEGAYELSVRPPLTHLSKIYIEPTNHCNLQCRTCIRNSWNEPLGHMDIQTFTRIMEGAHSLDCPTVFFGGFGEPLSHPQIINMIAGAKAIGSHVELITNGTLLTRSMSMKLIDVGLDMLWVSLDGARSESYADVRLGAALPTIIENLKGFVALRDRSAYSEFPGDRYDVNRPRQPQIGIVFVAMKRNINDLPLVIRLGKSLGATRFMVTNVLPYTAEMRDEVLYYNAVNNPAFQPSTCLVEIPKIDLSKVTVEPFIRAIHSGTTVNFAGADLAGSKDRCPFIERRAMAIAWDGRVTPCLPLLHDHKSYLDGLERFTHSYSVGNVRNKHLEELWKDPDYTRFRNRVDSFDDFSPCISCSGCALSEGNEYDCFGNTFPTCGGCLWAQGIVQCP